MLEIVDNEWAAQEDETPDIVSTVSISCAPPPSERLSKLPTELIGNIVKYLPPESAAALSLTCRRLHGILEQEYLRPLMKNLFSDRSYPFLLLMENNFPDNIICRYCHCSHRVTSREALRYIPESRLLGPQRYDPAQTCVQNHFSLEGIIYLNPFFSSTVFRMAMKRYRQGQNYTKYLKLLSPKELRLNSLHNVEWNWSLARIYHGKLLLRRQTIWITSPNRRRVDWSKSICAHISIVASIGWVEVFYKWADVTERILECAPWDIKHTTRATQCRFCYTEFSIDYAVLGGIYDSVVSTVWYDLGEGKSDLDSKWQSHISKEYHVSREPVDSVEFEPESIKSAFQLCCSEPESGPLLTPPEKKDLIKIAKTLILDDADTVRAAIDNFFNNRKEWYAGAKDPETFYIYRYLGNESMNRLE
ncbi:hypothetical protein F5884DRAFT_547539 [Xylogone sp. PMI_703]|nr:hypothetical protein F5884DRAFT_547539 [Xylogone sp. PMI_703]